MDEFKVDISVWEQSCSSLNPAEGDICLAVPDTELIPGVPNPEKETAHSLKELGRLLKNNQMSVKAAMRKGDTAWLALCPGPATPGG